jgi:hypothetical protein
MTALAVDLAVWIVAAVVTGSGALWRRSFLSLVFTSMRIRVKSPFQKGISIKNLRKKNIFESH